MRKRHRLLALAVLALLAGAPLAEAAPIRLSTSGVATLGAPPLEFERDAVAELETTTGAATIFFSEGNFTNSENVDAIHVLPNGHLVLSTAAEATIGSPHLTFADGDLVEYDLATNTGTLYFSEAAHFAADVDIDAVSIRLDGTILLSTDDTATLGTPPLTFLDGDVVAYDPVTGSATLVFSESSFGSDEDVDALHEMANGHLVLSVERATGVVLAGVALTDGDLVEYDPVSGTAALFFAESNFTGDENVDAVDLGCGNGVIEADEECDDAGESPGCNADCTLGTCGDGTVNMAAGEVCDDGNLIDGDGCDSNCTPTGCGNGVVTTGEDCDDMGESAACDANCTPAACGDGTLNGAAGETCDDGDLSDGDGCDSNCTPTGCGNTIVTAGEDCDDGGESAACDLDCTTAACGDATTNATAGEACDDGGTAGGDCCSATCGFEAATSPCPDDGDACTTVSECDGAGACLHLAEPAAGCFVPVESDKALLQIKDKSPDAKDRLVWKWLKGAVTTIADFGDPVATDDYTLCVYDVSGATPSVVLRALAPAGGVCGTAKKPKDCWKANDNGFKYVDKGLSPDGLLKVDLKQGLEPGKGKVVVNGQGDDLPLPALPLPLPLRVQLHAGNGNCWEAAYSAAGVKKNDGITFKAKAE